MSSTSGLKSGHTSLKDQVSPHERNTAMRGRSNVGGISSSNDKNINFKTMQRIDNQVKKLLLTTPKVVVYEYLESSETWERTSIEGTLFVYSRHSSPTYSLLVLNQLSSDNLVIGLNEKILVHTQSPFVLLRQDDKVFGLNFTDETICQKVGHQLLSVCQNGTLFHEDTDTSVPRPTPSPTLSDTNSSSSQEGQSEPIVSSYQQRKDQAKKSRSGTSRRVSEPVNKRGTPSPSMVPNGHRSRGGKRSPQPVVSKSHAHKRATSPKTQSGVYSPVTTRGPNQALPERAYSSSPQLVRKLFNENPPVPVSSSSHVLQTLFANASTSTSSQVPSETLPLQALSLEDIEHQMKSEVPSPIDSKGHPFPLTSSVASNTTNPFLLQPSVFSSNSSGENIAPNGQLIPNQLLLQPSVTTQIQLSVQPPTPHSHTTSSGPIPIPSTHIPHAPKFPSIPSLVHSPGMRAPPISHPTHNHTPQTTVSTKSNTAVIASPAHFETPPKPNVERPVRTSPVPVISTSSKAGLISPMQFSSVPQKSLSEPATTRVDLIKEEEGEESPSNIGLTKQQLQQALLYLIKNDPGFINTLHDAYIKSITRLS